MRRQAERNALIVALWNVGVTQAELAKRLGLHSSSVSQILRSEAHRGCYVRVSALRKRWVDLAMQPRLDPNAPP